MEYEYDVWMASASNRRLIKSIKTPSGYEIRVERWDEHVYNRYRSWVHHDYPGQLFVWIPALGRPHSEARQDQEVFAAAGLGHYGTHDVFGFSSMVPRTGWWSVGYFHTGLDTLETEEGRKILQEVIDKVEANLVQLDGAINRITAPAKAKDAFLAKLAG